MNATISYAMEFIPHPWDSEQRKRGVQAWCLVKTVKPEVGEKTWEPVAIFNLDSEANTFQGHVFATGLDGKLVSIHRDTRELFELRRSNR